MVILEHSLGNSQVSVYRTIGPTLVNITADGVIMHNLGPELQCCIQVKSIMSIDRKIQHTKQTFVSKSPTSGKCVTKKLW